MNELNKLKEIGFHFNKKYGQNFITDTNLLSAIVSDACIDDNDYCIEVGAGAGTLTRELCCRAKNVTAFEIDKNLTPILSELEKEFSNLEIIYGDVLKYDISEIVGDKKFHLVANLPYYITTPVIFHFLENPNLLSITVMVQKEVAERFSAECDTASYGAVTAQLASYGTAKTTRIVPRQMFTPPPNVDSAIVHLKINRKDGVENFAHLKKVIASAFAMRRKTLVNNLMSSFSLSRAECEDILNSCQIDIKARGETLDIYQFIELSNAMGKN